MPPTTAKVTAEYDKRSCQPISIPYHGDGYSLTASTAPDNFRVGDLASFEIGISIVGKKNALEQHLVTDNGWKDEIFSDDSQRHLGNVLQNEFISNLRRLDNKSVDR
jgi:hypothetical protein|tara:strand:- start:284 stop:604 length:321 start_codon:yes stop_codon:yes gene_type:complete